MPRQPPQRLSSTVVLPPPEGSIRMHAHFASPTGRHPYCTVGLHADAEQADHGPEYQLQRRPLHGCTPRGLAEDAQSCGSALGHITFRVCVPLRAHTHTHSAARTACARTPTSHTAHATRAYHTRKLELTHAGTTHAPNTNIPTHPQPNTTTQKHAYTRAHTRARSLSQAVKQAGTHTRTHAQRTRSGFVPL